MKCVCGARARNREGRGNNYNYYRLYDCPNCGKQFATIESRADYEECRKMIRKIFYVRYIKNTKKRHRRKGHDRER